MTPQAYRELSALEVELDDGLGLLGLGARFSDDGTVDILKRGVDGVFHEALSVEDALRWLRGRRARAARLSTRRRS